MSLRTPSDLINHPCLFKIKNYEKTGTSAIGVKKVKRIVQKLDSLGQPVTKIVRVPELKGCNCRGGSKVPTGKMIETKVPEVMEIWVDENTATNPTSLTLCKLFGSVACSHCLNCKTYKQSK